MKQLLILIMALFAIAACHTDDDILVNETDQTPQVSQQVPPQTEDQTRTDNQQRDSQILVSHIFLRVVDKDGNGLFSQNNSKGWDSANFKVLWYNNDKPVWVKDIIEERRWDYPRETLMYQVLNDSSIVVELDYRAPMKYFYFDTPIKTLIQWEENDTDTIVGYPGYDRGAMYFKNISYNGVKILDDCFFTQSWLTRDDEFAEREVKYADKVTLPKIVK